MSRVDDGIKFKKDRIVSSTVELNMELHNKSVKYYLNGVMLGQDEEGFNEFLDCLEQSSTVRQVIVYKDFVTDFGGQHIDQTHPYSQYERGYQALKDITQRHDIELIYGGI